VDRRFGTFKCAEVAMSRKIVICTVTFLGAAGLGAVVPVAPLASDGYVDGEIIVRLEPGVVEFPNDGRDVAAVEDVQISDPRLGELLDAISAYEFKTVCPEWRHLNADSIYHDISGEPLIFPLIDFTDVYLVRFDLPADAGVVVDSLRTVASVEYVHPNLTFAPQDCGASQSFPLDQKFLQTPTDPGQWGMHNPGVHPLAVANVDINAPAAWAIQPTCTKKIGIIDSGIDRDHPDLAANIDLVLSHSFKEGDDSLDDQDGHGTWMAGIVGGISNNIIGVAGLAQPQGGSPNLVVLKVDFTPYYDVEYYLNNIAAAISYAAEKGQIPILSISLLRGARWADGYVLREVMKNAYNLGLLMCCAGGNGGGGPANIWLPVGYDRFALGVGAITALREHPEGYLEGPWVDICAPGGSPPGDLGLWTTADGGGYALVGGTSSATAHVSGMSGLLLSHTPLATNEDLIEILTRNSEDIDPPGYDERFGSGLARLDTSLCALEDRVLAHGGDIGWDDWSHVAGRSQQFMNLPFGGAPENQWVTYWTQVYRLEKSVAFSDNPGNPMDSTLVWARGRTCSGWRDTTDLDVSTDAGWAGIYGSTVQATGCVMYSYFYRVFTDATEQDALGWFPRDPFDGPPSASPVSWSYSYLYLSDIHKTVGGVTVGASQRDSPGSGLTGRGGQAGTLAVPPSSGVTFELFDVRGRAVASVGLGQLSAPDNFPEWGTLMRTNLGIPPGIYFARLRSLREELGRFRVVVLR
jgi:hypothetical protein